MTAFRIDFYSLLYTTLFTLCSGFVLISSATAPTSQLNLYEDGGLHVYQWNSTLMLNEIHSFSKNVGFRISGEVSVGTLWTKEESKLLVLKIEEPKLLVKSKKTSLPQDFVQPSSILENSVTKPFLVLMENGKIQSVYLQKKESQALKNVKKGVAGLFQLAALDEEVVENDPSGTCKVIYAIKSPNEISKRRLTCSVPNINTTENPESILGTTTISQSSTQFFIDDSKHYFTQIKTVELHQIGLNAKEDAGGIIMAEQEVTHKESRRINILNAENLDEAIAQFSKEWQVEVYEESIQIEESWVEKNKKKFVKEVELVRENLKSEHLGTVKSAKAFLQLLEVARDSNIEDITKTLSAKKNAKILLQLYDILGYTQTKSSHQAVMKKLHLYDENQIDFIERYLWALSFSSRPNVDILEDLMNKYRKYTNIPEKIKDTLILTLASMAKTLASSKKHDYETLKVLKTVEETIINDLDYAKDDDRFVFFNALKNLQSPSTIPNLTNFVKNGTLKEEVLAWRTLKSFGKRFWTSDILSFATKTLFMLDKKHDTSARTIAADIILGSEISDSALKHLLNFVAGNDTNYEIKQYVFQSIKMLAEKDDAFNERVQSMRKGNPRLNNYSGLSPRGLSTALSRSMFKGLSSNGSLVSVQEINGGIVKRGVVDVVLNRHDSTEELFTLGIFSGGLSSFMSNGDGEDEDPDETSTAGMELTVLGRQIRPFVFFSGQGELVGHVWSGTASDMTPAFQALILWRDYENHIKLSNGFIANVNFKGVVSFDLSGKISISLWNKNSQSLIEKSVGLVSSGFIHVDSTFASSKMEYEASVEPKLSLEIDADFSSNVKLCMRLSQPDYIQNQHILSTQWTPDKNQQYKFSRRKRSTGPGITYALNRKNNEMCSAIFS